MAKARSAPAGFVSPLATTAQRDIERKILRILADPQIAAARAKARAIMAASPVAQMPERAARLDHTLDAWMVGCAFRVARHDPWRPAIT
jgi:hypothetical protein